MRKKTLDLLICLLCKKPLHIFGAQSVDSCTDNDDIISGIIECSACSKVYPIINGIPRLSPHLMEEEQMQLDLFLQEGTFFCTPREKDQVGQHALIESRLRARLQKNSEFFHNSERLIEKKIQYRTYACEHQEYYARVIESSLSNPIETILEIGGGSGGFIKSLDEYFNPSISVMVDYDPFYTDIARLRSPSIEVIRANAECLPFKNKSFDLVVSKVVLEHISDCDRFLDVMGTLTRKVCFISWNPNKNCLYDFGHVKAPITIFPKNIGAYIAYVWNILCARPRSLQSIREELKTIEFISTQYVRKKLSFYGKVHNVFYECVLERFRQLHCLKSFFDKKWIHIMFLPIKVFSKILIWLRIEPYCFYICCIRNNNKST